jgi:dedicated sortase system histidine kinase
VSLRLQLLAFVALTFFLPWAGLRIVEAMEGSLRQGLESLLERSAGLVAREVADSGALGPRGQYGDGQSPPLYVHTLSRPPRVDGDLDDWHFARDTAADAARVRAITLAGGQQVWLGIDASFLYLFVDVIDDEVVHQVDPGRPPHGDRIALLFGREDDQRRALLLASAGAPTRGAPGFSVPIRAQVSSGGERLIPTGQTEDVIYGWWQDTSGGYRVEARLPLSLVSRDARGAQSLVDAALGIGIVDSFDDGADATISARSWGESGRPNPLIGESPALARVISTFAGANNRYRVFDANGWVLADTGALEAAVPVAEDTDASVVERFFRWVLRREDPEYAATLDSRPGRIGDPAMLAALDGESVTAWYRRGADVSAIVAAGVPIDPNNPARGGVLVEEASDSILTLTNQAMLRLVLITVLVSLIATAALLGYASLLSFRIGRLARAAESALGPRGEITTVLPGTRAADEIGGLSRSFEDLLGRLRDYTDYLQSLKSKLSHELRTPLAIVATSVENLEHEPATEAGRTYLARLREGAGRLESILQAMTAATRVEQAIRQTEFERFDLAAVVGTCLASYVDVYGRQDFAVVLPDRAVMLDGSAELIAQMLDKLIDNAVGFAEAGTSIEVSLVADRSEVRLDVVNRGPLLPEAMRHQLFDSLVSVRDSHSEQTHLGLGLYIATLVAEFHGGRIAAENLADGSGVRFFVVLPCGDASAA